jgi:hypothetical protein
MERSMKKRLAMVGLSMCLAWSGMARAQVDLSTLDKDMAGPPSQVLVLGTVHLRDMPKDFKPETLDPLLDKLVAFKPEVITIEQIPGESCDAMARNPALYDPESIAPYCSDTDAAKAATGLDVPAAIAEANKTLAAWPAQPTATQRRHLAALFLAAGDRTSALTQWLQLPTAERHAGDGLDAALVALLRDAMASNSETYMIAAPLAARLGLQRVFPIDDHTGDNIAIADAEVGAYADAIRGAWASAEAQTKILREREQAFIASGDMPGLYRYINRPDVRQVQADGDFGAAMREDSPKHYARLYVAGWETRNLRMVANVRAAFRERPGARVLSIVGASHKPWFDSLLGQMQGVEIVDAEQALQVPASAQGQASEADAGPLAAIDALFSAMSSHDVAAARKILMPGATFLVVRADGATHADNDAGFLETLGKETQSVWKERIWSPQVRIDGQMAQVWAPYDFHLDGKFSHCGVDVFTLVQGKAGWRIATIAYTGRKDHCPPGG